MLKKANISIIRYSG